ncbi:MAG: sigma factor-like helix-turn-helix DNA-binding protein [Eubacterium sp.]
MSDKQFKELELQFQEECKVINLKYEYDGYNGDISWAIISNLSEDEILEKYRPIISDYMPFIVLTPAFDEVRDEYRRNEKKFQMRAVRRHDFYNLEDGEIELHHAELVTDDLEESFFKSEEEQVLRKAIQQLKPIQKERLIKYYFEGKSSRQIAKEEGVNYSKVEKSINVALKNLKKFLKLGGAFDLSQWE